MKGGDFPTWKWQAMADPNINAYILMVSCGVSEAEAGRLIERDTNNLSDEIHVLTRWSPGGSKRTLLFILRRNAPRAMHTY